MFSQEDIDAVLNAAQGAVDALAAETDELAPEEQQNSSDGAVKAAAQTESAAVATAVAPPPPPPPPPQAASPAPPPASKPASPPPAARRPSKDHVKKILKLRVPVVVRLAERKMLLSEILKVVPGTILEFSRTVDEELDLMVNNHQIGTGVAVKVNERFGLRVTYVGNLRERIESLGR